MEIYIVCVCGFKENEEPEIETTLISVQNVDEAAKLTRQACNVAKQERGFTSIKADLHRLDKNQIKKLLNSKSSTAIVSTSADWQKAIGYKGGKPIKD